MAYLEPIQSCALAPVESRANKSDLRVDIFVPDVTANASAQMFLDLFQAANDLLTGTRYRVTLRTLSTPVNEDPRQWQRRTVIFLGNLQSRWVSRPDQRNRLASILRLSPRSMMIGGAVFLMRDAGMNHDVNLAIHPNFTAAAQEEGLLADASTTVREGRINSASSGFAALPLIVDLIGEDHGPYIGKTLSAYLGLSDGRQSPQSREIVSLRHRSRGDRLIDVALKMMQEHIEEPLQIRELASTLGVSTRKLERRFQEKTGSTPLTVYRQLRIERAHQLISQTDLTNSEIAVATGFGSRANLAHWFRKQYGTGPTEARTRMFQRPALTG